jgi:hypothetical protein
MLFRTRGSPLGMDFFFERNPGFEQQKRGAVSCGLVHPFQGSRNFRFVHRQAPCLKDGPALLTVGHFSARSSAGKEDAGVIHTCAGILDPLLRYTSR